MAVVVLNSLFELLFFGVYLGCGRIIWGKDFGTTSLKLPKWKLVILGVISIDLGFVCLLLLLWGPSILFALWKGK